MTRAHDAFRALETLSSHGFDATALGTDASGLVAGIRRRRRRRAAGVAGAAAAIATAVVLVVVGAWSSGPDSSPAGTTSPTPSATTASPTPVAEPWCRPAQVVAGVPVNEWFGGTEGWWNATPLADCDEWLDLIRQHPDTVLINTATHTMVEGYFRTDLDARDAYAALAPTFVVDPGTVAWPENALVLIDAHSREVIEVLPMPDESLNPNNAVPVEP